MAPPKNLKSLKKRPLRSNDPSAEENYRSSQTSKKRVMLSLLFYDLKCTVLGSECFLFLYLISAVFLAVNVNFY